MSANSTILIEARPKGIFATLAALWQYRAFWPFLFREIAMKKFRATLLGFWWLILRPLIPATFAILVFTFVVPMDSYGLPYAIFYFSGMVAWNMFQSNVTFMPRTMLWMQGIMRRTYFPKLLVPLSASGPPLMELAVVFVMFLVAVGYFFYQDGLLYLKIGWNLLGFPVAIFMAYLFSTAIGMVCSVIALFAKDIVFSVRYFAQLFMFMTPVLYPVNFIPEDFRWILYSLNPMAKVVELSRWSLTGVGTFDFFFTCVSAGVILLTVAGCVLFFLRAEKLLADEI